MMYGENFCGRHKQQQLVDFKEMERQARKVNIDIGRENTSMKFARDSADYKKERVAKNSSMQNNESKDQGDTGSIKVKETG